MHKNELIFGAVCRIYVRCADNNGTVEQIDKKKPALMREMAKREEGGRASVSQIDVSMNAPIGYHRPRHSCKNKLCPCQSAE